MATIATTEAAPIYSKALVDMYSDILACSPTSFMQSWFKTFEAATRYISVEVERAGEPVAVDVVRGTEGNRNTFSKSGEQIYEPPLFREYFDITKLDLYDRLFASQTIDNKVMQQFLDNVRRKMEFLVNMIKRRYEVMACQVAETGIVTCTNGDDVNFNRKSGSLVDKGSGNYWATSGVSPYNDIEAGCDFIRQIGKGQGGTYNAIFGQSAWRAFETNDVVLARANVRNFKMDSVGGNVKNAFGGSLKGAIDCGSYTVLLWTYPETYDVSGTATPYINTKKVIILPEEQIGTLSFAAVPQLIDFENPTIKTGAFIFDEHKDKRLGVHEYDVQSTGLTVPTKLDKMYTVKVVA